MQYTHIDKGEAIETKKRMIVEKRERKEKKRWRGGE